MIIIIMIIIRKKSKIWSNHVIISQYSVKYRRKVGKGANEEKRKIKRRKVGRKKEEGNRGNLVVCTVNLLFRVR